MTNPVQSAIPYVQEAEEAVLGAILLNPSSYYVVAAFLHADDFYLLRHQYIWQAFDRLIAISEPIEYVTVQAALRDYGYLEEIGGGAYLTYLINNTPTSVHAEAYGRLVERAAVRRRLLVAADQIKALALDEQLVLEEVISGAESQLFNVSERRMNKDLVSMRQAIDEYWERLETLMQGGNRGSFGLPSGFKDLDTLLGGFQKPDLLIFAGRPGMGKCVTGDTLVATEHGIRPIAALKPADTPGIADDDGGFYYPLEIGVQTPDGLRSTAYFYDSGIQPTLKITTLAGYTLAGTYHHPVLVLSKTGEKVWKPLAELERGDFVAIQRHEPVWGNQVVLPKFEFEFYKSGFTNRPALPEKMTLDLAYVLGLLTGDGNLTKKNYVSISSADDEIVAAFYQWAKDYMLTARYRAGYDHTIGSVVLNTWLGNLGLGGYAYEKEIPHVILTSSCEYVRAYLQGLFDTDGHAEVQRGYLQYATSSEKLAHQLQYLLLQLGVISKLSYKANAYRGSWSIRITGDSARRFYNCIGFRLNRKQERQELLPETSNVNLDVVPHLPKRVSVVHSKTNYYRYFTGSRQPSYETLRKIAELAPEVSDLLQPEFYWDAIQTIEEAGQQHCYDLTVPDGQSFVTNGIVSHNTSFMLSAAINMARLGARIAIFSLEMGVDQIVQRLVSMEAGINTQSLRGGNISPQEWQRFVAAAGNLSNFRIFIDDSPALNPLQMRTKCLRLAREHGIDLVVVDYLQLMNAGGSYSNNRVQEISYISRSLKEMARELNVPVLSAAQLSRAVEQRQDKRPVLSDLRESGCLAGESLVYLPDSGQYVPVQELSGKTGFRVMSLNTATWKLEPGVVSNAFCTGVKPVYKLTTRLGRSIRATANHKFLTIAGWKRLDELTADDHIALPGQTVPEQLQQNKLAQSDVYWDQIASIEPDGETEVYDLTVPGNSNFLADNIVAHNSIEQDSDIVMFLYRDEVYNEATEFPNQADVIIAKHRNGPVGTISLYYEKTLTKFLNAAERSVDMSY